MITKKKKAKRAPAPLLVMHQDFVGIFPVPYQFTLPQALRMSREQRFPPYTKVGSQRAPAVFDAKAVLAWARDNFSLFPDSVRELDAHFRKMRKKRGAK